MFDFIFLIDWLIILKIIGVDLILGIDNAIVIALACAGLAEGVRNKAILIGTGGAILARIAFLFIGFTLLALPAVKFIAGAYLVYLAYSLLTSQDEGDPDIKSKSSMWGAIGTIVLADVMMSLDNVIAVSSASGGSEHGFAYSVFGIALAIPIIIFASKFLLKALDKFPVIMWLGSALIAYIGVELLLKENLVHEFIVGMGVNHLATIITVVTTAVTVGLAYLSTYKNKLAL